MKSIDTDLSRRAVLKASALAGGGLVLGFVLPAPLRRALAEGTAQTFAPNAWLRITPDNAITILVHKAEMGQGVATSMPMLVAEELEVDLHRVKTEWAPPGEVYTDKLLEFQATGGSTSVRSNWQQLREAGAAARTMLIAAAAEQWKVKPASCKAENGAVVHAATKRRLTYGELAEGAAKQPVPSKITLKPAKDCRYLGKPVPRLDTPAKLNGSAQFGQDVKLPGLLTAVLVQCPVFGGKVKQVDSAAAKAVKGVRHVVEIESGVAVVADGFWPAKLGRDALKIEWDEGAHAGMDSAGLWKHFEELAAKPESVHARKDGDSEAALKKAGTTVEAVYQMPYVAHATMEPMNCTVDLKDDRCDVYVGTQSIAFVQSTAAKLTGLKPEAITVHLTYLGGGFGRRFEQDFIAQAILIAKQVKAPVKLIWTREDDMQHDVYRPMSYSKLTAALDGKGMPTVWKQRIVSQSILKRIMPQNLAEDGKLDDSSTEGCHNQPYAIPNVLVEYTMADLGAPVGFWRSVGNSQNGFVTESFIDELAHAAKQDPLQYRLKLLAKHPRHAAVLKLAAQKAGWGNKLPEGWGRGLAVMESFGSYVAEVADVQVDKDGTVNVKKVVCAVDCGQIVNPDTIEAQMQSAIVYALSAALKGPITLKNGRIEQSNFHDYPVLRIDEMPVVEVHILPSKEAPGGVGEPGVPPLAPAVANAVFAGTGKRVRKLPISI